MFLEIITPEKLLFSSKVDCVTVPGIDGKFQVLNNHAPIISVLKQGIVEVHVHTQDHLELDELTGSLVPHIDDDKILTLSIKTGTIVVENNKTTILTD